MDKKEVTLSTPMDELESRILQEKDVSELNNIIDIFNLNLKKKDIIRANKLNELQDKIVDQMGERLEKKAGEFSNKDLLDYHKVIQETINKSDNSLNSIDIPSIQINQNQVNINVQEEDKLDRASRERIANAVKAILNKYKEDEVDTTNIVEVDEVSIVEEEGEDGI